MNQETKIHRLGGLELVLLIASTLTVMAGATIAPALTEMNSAFQAIPNSEFLVKLVLTITSLFIALGAPVSGVMLDRWGRKPVLTFSLILFGFSGVSGYFLDSLYAILVGRALLGIAVAGVMVTCTTLLGDYFSGPTLNKMTGLQAAFMGLGGTVFVILGGALAEIHWRNPFLIYLLGFIVLIGTMIYIYEPQISKQDDTKANDQKQDSAPTFILNLNYSLAFLGMVIIFLVPVQLPFYLSSLGITSNLKVGIALAAMTFVSAITSLLYQKLKAKFTFYTLFFVLFLLMGAGFVVISLAENYATSLIGLAIVGLGMGLFIPNINVCMISIAPPQIRGRILGILTMFLFLGQFFSPILSQPIITQYSLSWGYGFGGGILLALSGLFLILSRKYK